MNENLYKNSKVFWKKKIEDEKTKFGFSDDRLDNPNWKKQLEEATSLALINTYCESIRQEIRKKSSSFHTGNTGGLSKEEIIEYYECVKNDTVRLEIEIGGNKSKKEQNENLVNEYKNGLKKILGNDDDLKNWEDRIVKAGSSDKDILDLRNQITDLTNEKNDLEKQVKQKEKENLIYKNHRCNTPNNTELNQIKDELSKMTQEKNKLQGQLNQQQNQPNSNQPIPITPPLIDNKEEEEKERQENNQLSLEELKNKLEERQKEIRNLKAQLTEVIKNGNGENQSGNQTSSNPSNSTPEGNSKLFLGIVIGVLVMAILGGLAFFIAKKKKKNRFTSENFVGPETSRKKPKRGSFFAKKDEKGKKNTNPPSPFTKRKKV